jgi:hypothetical protein
MVDLLCNSEGIVAENRRKLPDQIPQRLLSWSEHVRSWADQTELPVAVFRYEDMLAQPEQTFGEIVQKLDRELDPERLQRAIAFSSFEKLRAKEQADGFGEKLMNASAPFFRQGRAGGWRAELSPQLADKIIATHAETMRRFGYLDENGNPLY